MTIITYDVLIIGTGIYGLYAADMMSRQGQSILVIDCDPVSFGRGSYINQARVHNGYHYPRSVSTAAKSAYYFQRFNRDFDFAINGKFKKIYAISAKFSFTNGAQFRKFCSYTDIPCREIDAAEYFQPGMAEAAFETEEYAFDAFLIRDWYASKLKDRDNVTFRFGCRITGIETVADRYRLILSDGTQVETPYVLNATYASVNQILEQFGFEKFRIKYEICEIALCKPNPALDGMGITVMDGPFFSVMPFGVDGSYSLTSVTFTPHITSFEQLPRFSCQQRNLLCTPQFLQNCNTCPARPHSAWNFMHQLARLYLHPRLEMEFTEALFAIKPILLASELDDSRPTVIREFSQSPRFVSVLSGKINTVYDLDEVL
ncbi:MAG: FAD-binding oxidoreductase [Candidatus Cloacimonetes bacterium]|nr:FAD-binding oxidoreductase [Candidatus Cloacimonadota bacterium]